MNRFMRIVDIFVATQINLGAVSIYVNGCGGISCESRINYYDYLRRVSIIINDNSNPMSGVLYYEDMGKE